MLQWRVSLDDTHSVNCHHVTSTLINENARNTRQMFSEPLTYLHALIQPHGKEGGSISYNLN